MSLEKKRRGESGGHKGHKASAALVLMDQRTRTLPDSWPCDRALGGASASRSGDDWKRRRLCIPLVELPRGINMKGSGQERVNFRNRNERVARASSGAL